MKYLRYKPMKFETGHNVYFISDLHFNHDSIIHFSNRPFKNVDEMNAILINNWNTVITEDAYVFILGDFCFGTQRVWKELLDKLFGKKILILGNHDYRTFDHSLEKYFIAVVDRMEIVVENQRIMLDHYPQISWNGMRHNTWQLYGHIHTDTFYNNILDHAKQFNVCVENINYTPISFKEVKEKLLLEKQYGYLKDITTTDIQNSQCFYMNILISILENSGIYGILDSSNTYEIIFNMYDVKKIDSWQLFVTIDTVKKEVQITIECYGGKSSLFRGCVNDYKTLMNIISILKKYENENT